MKYVEAVQYFVSNYEGPKITIVSAGVGTLLSQIQRTPGSSRIMNGIYLPYSKDSVFGMLKYPKEGRDGIKMVSEKIAVDMAGAAYDLGGEKSLGVGVTGAVTTNRERRGDNHAWISVYDGVGNKNIYLELVKLTSDDYKKLQMLPPDQQIEHYARIRNGEDELVSQAVLAILMKDNKLGNSLTKPLPATLFSSPT